MYSDGRSHAVANRPEADLVLASPTRYINGRMRSGPVKLRTPFAMPFQHGLLR